MNILSDTHKYSFSIDTLENYNKVLGDIAGIKKQIKQEIDAKKENEQNLVKDAIEEEILKSGATYDDLVNYNSLQEYITRGTLPKGSTLDDYLELKKVEQQKAAQQSLEFRYLGGGRKTRRRKAHPSTKKHKKRTKHKKRASTKKDKKNKKYKKKRPRTRKR